MILFFFQGGKVSDINAIWHIYSSSVQLTYFFTSNYDVLKYYNVRINEFFISNAVVFLPSDWNLADMDVKRDSSTSETWIFSWIFQNHSQIIDFRVSMENRCFTL